MGQILIRNLSDDIITALKAKAELSGKSLEQTVRDLLADVAPLTGEEKLALVRRHRVAVDGVDAVSKDEIREGLLE